MLCRGVHPTQLLVWQRASRKWLHAAAGLGTSPLAASDSGGGAVSRPRAPPVFGKPRRVVVTGIGLVTPLGVGVEHVWQGLMDGRSGLVDLDGEGFAGLPAQVAGRVPVGDTDRGGWDPLSWLEPSEARRLPPGIQFGLAAARQALTDAGWSAEHTPFAPQRTGVAIGTGISGAQDLLGCVAPLPLLALSLSLVYLHMCISHTFLHDCCPSLTARPSSSLADMTRCESKDTGGLVRTWFPTAWST
jgi:hypothetical protein